MNMARSKMKEKHISNEYWGDVVTCSVYILNRSPMKSMKVEVRKAKRSLNVPSHFEFLISEF